MRLTILRWCLGVKYILMFHEKGFNQLFCFSVFALRSLFFKKRFQGGFDVCESDLFPSKHSECHSLMASCHPWLHVSPKINRQERTQEHVVFVIVSSFWHHWLLLMLVFIRYTYRLCSKLWMPLVRVAQLSSLHIDCPLCRTLTS